MSLWNDSAQENILRKWEGSVTAKTTLMATGKVLLSIEVWLGSMRN